MILLDAAKRGATDLFIMPEQDRLRVRMRIDGVMHDVMEPPLKLHTGLVSRIKILAHLDISERRLPQDGRARLKFGTRELDCTVSTSPTLHGELVVIGMHERHAGEGNVALERSGLLPADLALMGRALRARSGLILVAGSAGSGRSTTLYGLMGQAASADLYLVSAEEHIRQPLTGVVQYQTRHQIGLTMALVLSKGLAHGPDVVMIDTIRETETARLAVQAATERIVLASVAGRDAIAGVTALLDMKVDEALLGQVLSVVIGQRLVRRPCEACRGEGRTGTAEDCTACGGSRFKGQLGVFQVLAIDDRLRQVLRSRRGAEEIGRVAVEHGLIGLREAALEAAERGETTAEEVARVFA